jgi:acyl dehydratase
MPKDTAHAMAEVRETLQTFVDSGEEFVSGWVTIRQDEVTDFARITRDEDPMHNDPDWARANSPYGGPIAFGFQVLALLTHFNYQIFPRPEGVAFALNYGLERVRFIEPVPVGALLRNRMRLSKVEAAAKGLRVQTHNSIEMEGAQRPACTAEWIGILIGHEEVPLHSVAS